MISVPNDDALLELSSKVIVAKCERTVQLDLLVLQKHTLTPVPPYHSRCFRSCENSIVPEKWYLMNQSSYPSILANLPSSDSYALLRRLQACSMLCCPILPDHLRGDLLYRPLLPVIVLTNQRRRSHLPLQSAVYRSQLHVVLHKNAYVQVDPRAVSSDAVSKIEAPDNKVYETATSTLL